MFPSTLRIQNLPNHRSQLQFQIKLNLQGLLYKAIAPKQFAIKQAERAKISMKESYK